MLTLRTFLAAAILALAGAREMISTEHLTESGCQARNGECVPRRNCTSVTPGTPRCDKKGIVCCGASTNRITLQDTDLDDLDDEDLTRGGKCKDSKCLNKYKGNWAAPGNCTDKEREKWTCKRTNMTCCLPPCNEKPACINHGGFVVSKRKDCPGKVKKNWAQEKNCFCCIVDRPQPFKEIDSHDIDICGDVDTFDLLGGAIVNVHTPNYPYPYPANMNCSLTINHASNLHFGVYVVESSLDMCSYDTLTFGNYSFCGVNSSSSYLVEADSVTFNFVTDDIQSNYGFFAEVSAVCDTSRKRMVPDPQYRTSNYYTMCNDSIINGTSGLINTNNYPCRYPNYENCFLELHVPNGYVINFTFIDFEVEYWYDCYYDYFNIWDDGAWNGDYWCGSTAPNFTQSSTNHVNMIFYSDFIVGYSGFLIYFNAVLP